MLLCELWLFKSVLQQHCWSYQRFGQARRQLDLLQLHLLQGDRFFSQHQTRSEQWRRAERSHIHERGMEVEDWQSSRFGNYCQYMIYNNDSLEKSKKQENLPDACACCAALTENETELFDSFLHDVSCCHYYLIYLLITYNYQKYLYNITR